MSGCAHPSNASKIATRKWRENASKYYPVEGAAAQRREVEVEKCSRALRRSGAATQWGLRAYRAESEVVVRSAAPIVLWRDVGL